MTELLLLWLLLLCGLTWFAVTRKPPCGALTLAYFLGLSIIHVPGVLAYTGSFLYLADRAQQTRIGFELTLTALTAFVVGAVVARQFFGNAGRPNAAALRNTAAAIERVGLRALGVGAICYFVIMPIASLVPSFTAAVSPLGTFLILGIWLRLYGAMLSKAQLRILATLALLPTLPLATLATSGFLGYGINWLLSVITFFFVILRRRLLFYLATPVAVFLGLSFFVTYMGQRTEIRELVWQEHASMMDRLDRMTKLVTDFHFLDLDDRLQRMQLDERLNQNYLVGAGVMYHEAGMVDFAYGGTVPAWSLIPRAIWPEKPIIGGGLDIVSEYTGIKFGKNTSVGTGQVLEFYINFGKSGVIVGFAILGFVLMWLDCKIMSALAETNMRRLILCGVPGLIMLQPGGNLLEIFIALIAGIIISWVVVATRFFWIPTVSPILPNVALRPPRNMRMIGR